PKTIARAGFVGMVSSSCSYAAAALAKTLFSRGADFTASQIFMFASTNLVIELGLVLWLLLGWQFALAEFVGGLIMIAVLAVGLPRVVPDGDVRAHAEPSAAGHDHGGGDEPSNRVRSLGGWASAASYTISDLSMLRNELVIGFVVAGFADTAVPVHFW